MDHHANADSVDAPAHSMCCDGATGRRTAGLVLIALLVGACLPFALYDVRSLSEAAKDPFLFYELPKPAARFGPGIHEDAAISHAPASSSQAEASQRSRPQAGHRRPPRVAVVFNAHENDDVAWLLRYFSDLCLVPYAHDAGPYMPRDAGPNMGYEQSTLLRFIIDHYDALPRHIVALHGDRSSWHSDDMAVMLRRVNFTALPDDAFFNLNYLTDPANWAQGILFQRIGNCSSGCNAPQLWRWINAVWPTLYAPWLGPMTIPHVETYCCMQFVIGRARILRHPRALYEHMLRFLQTPPDAAALGLTDTDKKPHEQVIEYTWRYVVTGEHNYSRLEDRDAERCRHVECPLAPGHYFLKQGASEEQAAADRAAGGGHLRPPSDAYPCEPDSAD